MVSDCRPTGPVPGHFGLRGLADRVDQLGGSFDIGSAGERGARLTATIPLTVAA
jgi:signal transduction histidine kinase